MTDLDVSILLLPLELDALLRGCFSDVREDGGEVVVFLVDVSTVSKTVDREEKLILIGIS